MQFDSLCEELGMNTNTSLNFPTSHNMHIFALTISVLVTTAGNGARFCATSASKIGSRKCFILILRRLRLSVLQRKL